MSPVNVLVVAHDAGMGGAQHSLLEIIGRLDPAKYRPTVLVPTPGPFVAEVRKRGFACHCGLVHRWVFFKKPMTIPVLLRKPWRLFMHPHLLALFSLIMLPVRIVLLTAWAKKERIGLVYSNTITVLDGALLARILGVPHVWHLREAVVGNPDLSSPISPGWLPGFILGWSDCVIVNSHALQSDLFGAEEHGKVKVIWNGVSMDLCADVPRVDLDGVPPGAPLTAICGRLNERKGIPVYLAAVARLQQDHPDAHHLIIGEGQPEYLHLLREEVAKLGLKDSVHFLGYRGDVHHLLAGVDVLVSAAMLEPFGRTLIEAMALGVPVIATRSGGPEEIIEDGESGFLVDVNDESALAERMTRLLGDRELSRKMGSAGKQRARKHFDLLGTVAGIENMFEQALVEKM